MTDAMLGAIFSALGAEEQAEFLNGAGKALRRCCADSQAFEMQACWIVDKLDGNGRDLVKRLASFIQHDEETPRIVKQVKTVPVDASVIEVPEFACGAPTMHGSGRVFLCTEPEGHGGNHKNEEHSLEWEASR